MLKLSIIIPAYNVEKYIGRCLDSIFSQGMVRDEFEVIVVDDGSSDGAAEVASRYDVRLIRQVNRGVSAARNVGIEASRGEYLWFVDGDDYLGKDCMVKFVDKAIEMNVDVLCFDARIIEVSGKNRVSGYAINRYVITSGTDAIRNGFEVDSVCSSLWKRRIIVDKKVRFKEDIRFSEDSLFAFSVIIQAESICYLAEVGYNYEQRLNSASNETAKNSRVERMMADVKVIVEMRKYGEVGVEYSDKVLFGLVYAMFCNRNKINEEVLDELKRVGLYPLKLKNLSLKKKFFCSFLNNARFLLCFR